MIQDFLFTALSVLVTLSCKNDLKRPDVQPFVFFETQKKHILHKGSRKKKKKDIRRGFKQLLKEGVVVRSVS